MQAFQKLTSQFIPLDLDHVDTDMIIPAQYLTKIDRDGYGENLFQRLREQDKNFVFNDPCYFGAEILLTKENFGCGSSREHAVWALMQAGIKVIIAQSYSDIFYSNATKNGLLTICLDEKVVAELIRRREGLLTIDLVKQTITTEKAVFAFAYDAFLKECFIKGQDDIDYLLAETTEGSR